MASDTGSRIHLSEEIGEDEKIAMWENAEAQPTEENDSFNTLPTDQDALEDNADEQHSPQSIEPENSNFSQERALLRNSRAYKQLLDNIYAAVAITNRKGTRVKDISNKIDAALSYVSSRTARARLAPTSCKICFDVEWDLLAFLRDEEYENVDTVLGRVITLTGSPVKAQATSCLQYLQQTWPSGGHELLNILQEAVGNDSHTSKGNTVTYQILWNQC